MECVGRRAYTHGRPTTVSLTYQQVKNSQTLLEIPRTASLCLLLDRYVSSEGKSRWLSSGWPRPFQLISRFHWTKRSPRGGPTFRKPVTTNWQLPWHRPVRRFVDINAKHVVCFFKSYVLLITVHQCVLHWIKVWGFFVFLLILEENLMMSIAADNINSSSDSGRDSPRTPSSLSNTWSTSFSSWPEQRELQPLWGADTCTTLGPQSGPPLYEPRGLYRCASLVSVDSMASTLLPSFSPDSGRSPSATRIGTEGSAQSKYYDSVHSTNFTFCDTVFLVLFLVSGSSLELILTYTEVKKKLMMSLCWLQIDFLYI